MESSVNTELLRGRVDTFILNSLSEKDGYGYDILSYIHSKTKGHYKMKQSSIYSVLKRLENQGLIVSYQGEESKGGPRRYYSLTDQGRKHLEYEQKQWKYTRTLLNNLVTEEDFDLENDTPPFKPSDLRPLTKRTKNSDPPKEEEKKEEKTITYTDSKKEKEELMKPKESLQRKQANSNAYRQLFSDIYNKTPQKTPKPMPPTKKDNEIDCHHINDLKNILKNEGYSLKSYQKDEVLGLSKNRMIYSNKIFRDTCFLTFLFFALCSLIVYRFSQIFMYSQQTILIIGLSGLILPLLGFTVYLTEPKKRKKASFNFRLKISYAVMILLLVFVINLIISLVTPSIGLTLNDPKLYPPVIFSLFVPFSVLFYYLLYSSNAYTVKL